MKAQKILILIAFLALTKTVFAENKFDGAYAGIDLGYVSSDTKGETMQDGRGDDPGPTGWSFKNTSIDSALFGGFVGLNKVFDNNALIGFEADYEFRNGDKTSREQYPGGPSNEIYAKSKLSNTASVRAKLGYVFNNNQSLVYVNGGYAAAKAKNTSTAYPDIASESKWHNGWTAGFGAEHFVTNKVSLKGEYRYSDYRTERYNVNVPEATYMYGWYHDIKLESENSMRVGVAYHF